MSVSWKFEIRMSDETGDANYFGEIDLSPPIKEGEDRYAELEDEEHSVVYLKFTRKADSTGESENKEFE